MEPSFIYTSDDTIVGVDLSSDFCSEHEWGISRIKRALGVPEKLSKRNAGLKARTITRFDERMFFFDTKGDYSLLAFAEYGAWRSIGEEIWRESELNPRPDDLSAAWSDGDFGLVVAKPYQSFLEELFEVFKRKDIAIGLGRTLGLQNPSLTIFVASRFPKDERKTLRHNDLRRLRLLEAVAKTGIGETLKKAGKRYHALSPEWADDEEREIKFWLNPEDQQNNNWGWFTLQDLIDWTQDKGRIPKTAKK